MFWKKNKKKKNYFTIKDEKNGEKRRNFRVNPTSTEPIHLNIANKFRTYALNISAGGIGFKNNNFSNNTCYDISFTLPLINYTIIAQIKIIEIDKNDICHTKFKKLSSENANAIHKYVLKRQMQTIREDKDSDSSISKDLINENEFSDTEYVKNFLKLTQELFQEVKAAYQEKNYQLLDDKARPLKKMILQIGESELADEILEFQIAIRDEKFDTLPSLFENIEEKLGNFIIDKLFPLL